MAASWLLSTLTGVQINAKMAPTKYEPQLPDEMALVFALAYLFESLGS